MKQLRTYAVTVNGFSPGLYEAKSPSQARTFAYRTYMAVDSKITFAEFTAISTVERVEDENDRLNNAQTMETTG